MRKGLFLHVQFKEFQSSKFKVQRSKFEVLRFKFAQVLTLNFHNVELSYSLERLKFDF